LEAEADSKKTRAGRILELARTTTGAEAPALMQTANAALKGPLFHGAA
jgi:hypothetical protein